MSADPPEAPHPDPLHGLDGAALARVRSRWARAFSRFDCGVATFAEVALEVLDGLDPEPDEGDGPLDADALLTLDLAFVLGAAALRARTLPRGLRGTYTAFVREHGLPSGYLDAAGLASLRDDLREIPHEDLDTGKARRLADGRAALKRGRKRRRVRSR